MRISDFSFDLPRELIAQHPAKIRSGSRLLCLDRANGDLLDRKFTDLINFLRPGDLLVLNNTEVIPARLFGKKSTGGKVEILVERLLGEKRVLAQIRASKAPKVEMELQIAQNIHFKVVKKNANLYELVLHAECSLMEVLQRFGHMPLPPYIERDDQDMDRERYQTVFAEVPGAVAAPTAGLHFTPEILQSLRQRGIKIETITLHVGAGTFSPIRVDDITEHKMHSEFIELSPQTCESIKRTKANRGRVIAVGTTSVRCLETAARDGELKPYSGETDIFIKPGYQFRVVDALLTNFHLSQSSLLVLVSAFAGTASILRAYNHAVSAKYRFFSYGDAMFIGTDLQVSPGVE
ncbi:MAG: tRNA preQ1(34) S-adenosylmethionine ribosyltransferase-isomerase QueA [Thiohalomonadales bacterium]